jgi:tetratricopeptide (TPR) repeat protein
VKGGRVRTGVIAAAAILVACIGGAVARAFLRRQPSEAVWIAGVLAGYRLGDAPASIAVSYPATGTLFPPEIVPPTFRWIDTAAGAGAWILRWTFPDEGDALTFLARSHAWTPDPDAWESIKRRSVGGPARITLLGVDRRAGDRVISEGSVAIATSRDPVDAPIFYREVNLPFIDAVKDPTRIRWRFGAISSPAPPPIVLENLPVCGNCHSFPRDGSLLAMDVDYANSKASYVVTRVAQDMTLATSDIITWNDFRPEDTIQTFGLLSQISPDGRYVISTVKDRSVFVPKDDLCFSQLFFPLKGILAVYDRAAKAFAPLPGADDPRFVQSNPTWSPDGGTIVFARTIAYDLAAAVGKDSVLLRPEECREFISQGKPFLFDLYRIPFNGGAGGAAEPIEGASRNGMSNFFARYSPDGKWIVYCRARSYMLLQPDSELWIVPAQGGAARRLACNTSRMNSWHSWSPNGRWLVFSSKANSPYTQLFLTHIDAAGESTPPVLLAHFTSPDRAANIPEFVNAPATAISRIRAQFLDDYSFVRVGNQFFRYGDADDAIRNYRKALELNPRSSEAHQKLGFLLFHVKSQDNEGMEHSAAAVACDPANPFAQYDYGVALLLRGSEASLAERHLAEAVRLMPRGFGKGYDPAEMRLSLARALIRGAKADEAVKVLHEALAFSPAHAAVRQLLAEVTAARDAPRP